MLWVSKSRARIATQEHFLELGGERRTMEDKRKVKINREWCKGCRICVAFCPKSVLEIDAEGKASWAHPENCIRCGLCELRCPDLAIEFE